MISENRYNSHKKGYFPIENALFCHIVWLRPQAVRKPEAFKLVKYDEAGKVIAYGLYGNSKGIADDHNLLKIKDKSRVFTPEQVQALPALRKSEISNLVGDLVRRLYARYLRNQNGSQGEAIGIEFFELTADKSLESSIPIVKIWDKSYQFQGSYAGENYWFVRNPIIDFYAQKRQNKAVLTLASLLE